MLVLNHIHKRKQKNKKISNAHKMLDQLIYLFAIIGPLMTIPQIMNIWVDRTSGGVSLISWASYLFIDFIWLYYGLVHRDKAILFANTLWIIVNSMVVIGLLMC